MCKAHLLWILSVIDTTRIVVIKKPYDFSCGIIVISMKVQTRLSRLTPFCFLKLTEKFNDEKTNDSLLFFTLII